MLRVDIEKHLPDFSLRVAFEAHNEFLVLFGPSGAGKSLTLGSIAGLVRPDAGEIQLDDHLLFHHPDVFVPIHRRGIGVVFQGYALFPHMTVAQNVAYGLRYMQGRGARVMDMLHRLHLDELAHRYPHQLSGGQQQRVALGRALIVKPSLLLLDEPFSALDMAVRERLQADIVQIQRDLQLTVMVITHNLDDAFVLGDKLAVLKDGSILQLGAIGEVYNSPATAAVAEILGVSNIWRGEVASSAVDGVDVQWGGCRVRCQPAPVSVGEMVTFYIRPEDVKVIHPQRPIAPALRANMFDARITHLSHRGGTVVMTVAAPMLPAPVHLRFPQRGYRGLNLREGGSVRVSLRMDAMRILPPG